MKKRLKRSQIQSQIFVYLLVAIILGFLLIFAYTTIKGIGEKKVEHQMILFQENLKKDIEAWALHIGSVGEEEYDIPSFITRACFVDLSRREEILNKGFFEYYPLVIDSLETTNNNMFLFDEKDNFFNSVYVGEVNLLTDYNCQPFTCFDATNNVLELLMLGRGHSTLLLPADVDKGNIITCDCPRGCRIRPIANFTSLGHMQYLDVTFNASESYDIDDYIVEYLWEFGDGENKTTTTPITQHIYNEVKTYPVTLTVFDVDELKGTMEDPIDIIPYRLIANAGLDMTAKVGEEIVFDASKSIGRILTYYWYLGDIKDTEKEGEVVSFYYYQKGEKIAILNVTDIFGNTETDTLRVEVSR